MNTKSAAIEKKASTEVAPAFFNEVDMIGAGVNTSNMLIPMVRILQQMSPEVEKKGASYIPGAEPGSILIKNAPNPLINGDEGFVFQPCFDERRIVEYIPRQKGGGGGAGFVGANPIKGDPNAPPNVMMKNTFGDDAVLSSDPNNPDRKVWTRKSTNNLLVDTRYINGFIIAKDGAPMPAVISFASTGHTVARNWDLLMAMKRLNGKRVDTWAVYYRLTTKLKTRGTQAWYVFDVKDAGPLSDGLPTTLWCATRDDYERGRALHDSLKSGQQQFETVAEHD